MLSSSTVQDLIKEICDRQIYNFQMILESLKKMVLNFGQKIELDMSLTQQKFFLFIKSHISPNVNFPQLGHQKKVIHIFFQFCFPFSFSVSFLFPFCRFLTNTEKLCFFFSFLFLKFFFSSRI